MCVNYLISKIPENDKLKEMKVEMLAKTGNADEARNLLRGVDIAGPDGFYLKGIIELYGGDSAKAKKMFQEGMRQDPDNNKCRLALNKAKKSEQLKEQGNELIK
jgi:DnaJ family protein C protein 7